MSYFASICHCQNVIVIEMCQQIEYYIPEITKTAYLTREHLQM